MIRKPLSRKKIGVLQLARLGDILMTLPVVAELSKKYRHAEIDFFVNSIFRDLLPRSSAFRLVPISFNDMVPALEACKTVEQRLGVLNAHLGEYFDTEYDLVINCSGLEVAAILTSILKAKRKRGMEISTDKTYIQTDSKLSLFTKHKTGRKFDWSHQMEIFIAAVDTTQVAPLHAYCEPLFGQTMDAWLGERKIQEKYVLFFPGASIPEKEIGPDLLHTLVRTICERTDYQVVFAGRADDGGKAGGRQARGQPIADWTGKTGYAELFNLIQHAECVVSNDSGPMHIASFLNTKNLVISNGAAYFPETCGYNQNVLVFVPKYACYPCPWIGYPCSENAACQGKFDGDWIANWLLYYLGLDEQAPSGTNSKAYRTKINDGGIFFYPIGDKNLDKKEWLGIIYQAFWKGILFGENAEIILQEVLGHYHIDPKPLREPLDICKAELAQAERLVGHLIQDFESLFTSGGRSWMTRVDHGIQRLMHWSHQEMTLTPLLHYHNVLFHSVVQKNPDETVRAYYENTLDLMQHIEKLKGLILFIEQERALRV